jgi:pyruvate/2-oxoglutarate dehydrogenase complex dihydrolipoamide acyltransferase (E2) component
VTAGRVPVLTPRSVWQDVDDDVDALLDAWHVDPGERVNAGQRIATIMIVKTSLDIQAPATGRIQIAVAKGATFSADDELAIIITEPT